MREVLSISVDKKLKDQLEKAARRFKISKSELVKLAIERYIAHKEFAEIQSMLIPYAEKAGFLTDEDIFKNIS